MAEFLRRSLLATPLLMAQAPATSVFDFSLSALEGGALPLEPFRGKALLVVNTASFCAFTPQYAALQTLHDRFAPAGFSVIGVPSNDFGQESAGGQAVREFCDTMYGIDFPLAGLTSVRGRRAHPLYAWLAARAGGAPGWNFHKYLVGRDGLSVRAFRSEVPPDAPALLRAVQAALEGRPLA